MLALGLGNIIALLLTVYVQFYLSVWRTWRSWRRMGHLLSCCGTATTTTACGPTSSGRITFISNFYHPLLVLYITQWTWLNPLLVHTLLESGAEELLASRAGESEEGLSFFFFKSRVASTDGESLSEDRSYTKQPHPQLNICTWVLAKYPPPLPPTSSTPDLAIGMVRNVKTMLFGFH